MRGDAPVGNGPRESVSPEARRPPDPHDHRADHASLHGRTRGLVPGTRLGPYEIVDLHGAGGMDEVYRARDMRLRPFVAVKILPDAVSQHPGRIARFVLGDRDDLGYISLSRDGRFLATDITELKGNL